MCNVLIIADTNDNQIGKMCESYALYTKNIVDDNASGVQANILHNPTRTDVEGIVSNVNSPFEGIVVCYSHGDEYACLIAKNPVLDTEIISNMQKAIVFAMACNTGRGAGAEIHTLNLKNIAYVGFEQEIEVHCSVQDTDHRCKAAGLSSFLAKEISIQEAIESMKKYYTSSINKYRQLYNDKQEQLDLVFLSKLASERDSLVVTGNLGLTKKDLGL